jgi:exopolysaccharide biosynthesis polyprenyl glycosylphosphotransferase
MVQTASLTYQRTDQHIDQRISYKKLDLRSPSLAQIRKGITIDSLRILSLLGSDCLSLLLTWGLTQKLTGHVSFLGFSGNPNLTLLFTLAIHIWFIATHRLYGADENWRQYGNLIKAIGLAQISLILLASLIQDHVALSSMMLALGWIMSSVAVCGGRWLIDRAIAHMRQAGKGCYPSLLICTPDKVDQAVQTLSHQNRYQLKGWVDASIVSDSDGWNTALSHIDQMGISEVFLWPSVPIHNSVFFYWSLRNAGIKLHVLPSVTDIPLQRFEVLKTGRSPHLTFAPPLITGSDFWVKRSIDFCGALILLLLLSPLLFVIALLIKLDSPGPVFFKQTRMGLKNQEFKAWKFRTMVSNAEQLQKQLEAQNETKDGVLFKIKADPRITRVGGFLRQYSLDELPQLINVLLGEMSLVGPRPLPLRDIEKFASHHFIRHEVLPGITGLWQVSGRSDIVDFEDVVRLDLRYIENWSLWLDVRILFNTVKVVLQKTGAY